MIEVEVPAIVSTEDWEFIQSKLRSRTRVHRPDFREDHQFLLRRRVICRECGQVYHSQVMEAKTSSGTRPRDYRYYRHPATDCPNTHTYRRDELEVIVKHWIQEWIDDPETDWYTILTTATGDDVYLTEQIADAQARVDELDPERKRLIRLATKGNITEDELAEELERIERDRRLLTAEIERFQDDLSSAIYLEIKPAADVDDKYKILPADWLDWEYKHEYTFKEWLAKIREHDIEIEVGKDGGLWGSFAASPDVYSLVSPDLDTMEVPLGDPDSEPSGDPKPNPGRDNLSASDGLHLLSGYDRFNALLLR